MTEQSPLPPPDEANDYVAAPPHQLRRDLRPWFFGLGFIILAAAIFYVWYYPRTPSEVAANAVTIRTIEDHDATIDDRLDKLEKRSVPDLGKVSAQVDAMGAQLNALDGKVAGMTQLASRLDMLSGRIESLSGGEQSALEATRKQLDTLTSRFASLQSNADSVDAVTKRLNRVAKIQEASFALAAGRPIGNLPDAPEALERYTRAPPPTLARLRQLFPRAAQAASATQQPDEGDAPFINRVLDKAEGLITIRRGDDVVVGNTSATILSHAQAALDAGNLAGAVDAVATLKGKPAQAMANWLAEARSLLGAQSALAKMADSD